MPSSFGLCAFMHTHVRKRERVAYPMNAHAHARAHCQYQLRVPARSSRIAAQRARPRSAACAASGLSAQCAHCARVPLPAKALTVASKTLILSTSTRPELRTSSTCLIPSRSTVHLSPEADAASIDTRRL
eukprot:6214375-Pleurochrysis_carterae.AAC.6